MSKFVVVKVGQLREHVNLQTAEKEALRLTDETGHNFYVAELCHKTESRVRTIRESAIQPLCNTGMPRRHNAPWSGQEEAQCLALYIAQIDIPEIARLHERTEGAIVCRLEKLGVIELEF